MATDKRLDQVSQLTDFDYALIVKGTDVAKVTKQQFAELVGNLLYGATTKETLASVVAEQIGVATATKNGLLRKGVLYKSKTIGTEISAGVKREISFSGGLFMFKSSYHSTEETLFYATGSKIGKISDTYDYTKVFAFDYKNGILSITNTGDVPKSVYAIMFELSVFRND